MAQTESRVLEIVARVKDLASSGFLKIANTIAGAIKGTLIGSMKLLAFTLETVKKTILGMGAVALGAFGFLRGGGLAKDVIDATASLERLAKVSGSTVEAFSGLKGAFSLAGFDDSMVDQILKQLTKVKTAVLFRGEGGDRAGSALSAIGISIDDLRKSGADELLVKMADGLSRVGTESARVGVLSKIFPETFQEISGVLLQGQGRLKAYLDQVRDYGGVVSKEAVTIARSIQESAGRTQLVLGGVFRDAILELARDFKPFVDSFNEFVRANRAEFVELLKSLVRTLIDLAAAVGKVIAQIAIFFAEGLPGLTEALAKIPLVGDSLASAVEKLTGEGEKIEARKKQIRELAEEYNKLSKAIAARSSSMQNPALKADVGADGMAKRTAELDAYKGKLEELRVTMNALSNANDAERGVLVTGTEGLRPDAQKAVDMAKVKGLVADLRKGIPSSSGPPPTPDASGAQEPPPQEPEFLKTLGEGIQKTTDKWRDFTGAVKEGGADLAESGLGGLSNAFSSIILRTKSWKTAFRDLGKSMLETIAQLIPKLIIVRTLSSIFGGTTGAVPLAAEGGVFRGQVSRTLPVKAYARGGIADRPQMAIFGEAGQEAFVPLTGGRIPVQLRGGGNRGQSVVFNITAMDSVDVKRVLQRERGTILGIWRNGVEHDRSAVNTIREGAR